MYTVVEGTGLVICSLGHDPNLQTHETWTGPLLLDSCHGGVALQRLCTVWGLSQQAMRANWESLSSKTDAATV